MSWRRRRCRFATWWTRPARAGAARGGARHLASRTTGLEHWSPTPSPACSPASSRTCIVNAVQYNREGGAVRITGFDEPAPGDAWEAGRVRLEVTDTGPGIPPEEWERVFDRFYRREPSRSRRTGGAGPRDWRSAVPSPPGTAVRCACEPRATPARRSNWCFRVSVTLTLRPWSARPRTVITMPHPLCTLLSGAKSNRPHRR